MPFDGQNFEPIKPDLSFATDDEGLLRLAALLESEQEWRDTKMIWHFPVTIEKRALNESGCGTAGCALGLAHQVWREWRDKELGNFDIFDVACSVFGITSREAYSLFDVQVMAGLGYQKLSEVTPGDVARGIRRFVAQRKSRAA